MQYLPTTVSLQRCCKVEARTDKDSAHIDAKESPRGPNVLQIAQSVRNEKITQDVKRNEDLLHPMLVYPYAYRNRSSDCHHEVELPS